MDQASLLDRIGKYSQSRDAAIAKFDLDTDAKEKVAEMWQGIDAKVVVTE